MKIFRVLFLLIISTSHLFPQELNGPTSWETIGDVFSQPNVHLQLGRNKLDWYGSGDVNNDEVIDNNDLVAMNNNVINDRSDVDGDGNFSTSNDKLVLQNYLNGTISYLPGHWNFLTSEGERVSWLEKMIKINDPVSYVLNPDGSIIYPNGPKWQCRNFIRQMEIDFYGLSNINGFIQKEKDRGEAEYHQEDNSRFNIPLQYFSTVSTSGVFHAISGTLIGDNPLEFNDWYFVGFEDDDRVYPGDYAMDGNEYAEMRKVAYVEAPIFHDKYFAFVEGKLNFDLENGEVTRVYTYWDGPTDLLLTNPNNFTIDVEDPQDKTVNYQVNLDTNPIVTGTPQVNVSINLTPTLTYEDGVKTPTNSAYPNIEYYFLRLWTGSATNKNDVTRTDLETQKITVKDLKAPTCTVPEDITLTNEEVLENGGLDTNITGNATKVKDNSNLVVTINLEYELQSANENGGTYKSIFTLRDVFSNSSTYSSQTITIVNSQISIENLSDIVVNAERELDLSPEGLKQLGFKSEPNVTVSNSSSDYTLEFTDSDTIYFSTTYPWADREFTRTFIAQLNNGSDADTMKCRIVVKDLESPKVENLESITITKDQFLDPTVTGFPEITDNVAVQDTVITYDLISENSTEKNYKAVANVTDVFGNDTIYHYQDVKVDLVADIEDVSKLPMEYKLSQNYPNPFNPTTKISYSLKVSGNVNIELYDLLGNKVLKLVDEYQSGGSFVVEVDASNLSAGIYFYKLTSGNFISTKKMVVLK